MNPSVGSIATHHASPWRIWRSSRHIGLRWQRFAYSLQTARLRRWLSTTHVAQDVETFEIRCGASGGITVDIYDAEKLSNPSMPLIVYFPSYGAHHYDQESQLPAQLEKLRLQAAIAKVNYRWNIPSTEATPRKGSIGQSPTLPASTFVSNQNHSFPTPIHDASFAFDFLMSSYLPNLQEGSTSYPTPPSSQTHRSQRPIILAGTFLGGTLATSLAVTSTFANARNATHYIAGLITYNAPFDWTSTAVLHPSRLPDQPAIPGAQGEIIGSNIHPPQHDDTENWTAQSLLDLRTTLFTSPNSTFDSFASPVLFFHTPGYIVPSTWPGSETEAVRDRYSTSLDDSENDDLVFEAPDFDVAGDGERGEAEIIGSAGSKQNVKKEEKQYVPQIARTSYLKFPPTIPATNSGYSRLVGSGPLQEQLKIPKSLFLYSSPPSENIKAGKQKRVKKAKSSAGIDQVTPAAQAKEMARLMQRSVLMVESKDRSRWDDSFDANSVAEKRVRVLDIGEEGSAEKVKEWFEDCLE